MDILIVFAHPEPKSFNGALKDRAVAALTAAGHKVAVSDLFAEGFNPVAGRHDFATVADAELFHYQREQALAAREMAFAPEVAREQERLSAADFLILQFPLWWGGVPAILKGWFERVLAYGFAYVDGHRFEKGLFGGRRAMLSVTTGGTERRFSPQGEYGEIERVLWQAQRLTLEYMGYEFVEPFVAYAAPRVDQAARETYLRRLEARVLEAAAKPVVRRSLAAKPLELVPSGAWGRDR